MINKILSSKFKKDLSFSYITQLCLVLFGFVQVFIINKYFGVNIYGQITIINSTIGMFSMLITARSSEAVTRFFKREELNGNYENAKFVLCIGVIIDLITAIILVAVIYFVSDLISERFLKDNQYSKHIILYSFITFFSFLRGSFTGYFQAKEKFELINLTLILESLIKTILLIVIINKENALYNIIMMYLYASFFSFLFSYCIAVRNINEEYNGIKIKINTKILKEYWGFNVKTFISSSIKSGNRNIDNIILAYFLDAKIVGLYELLKKIASPLAIISSPLSSLYYPKFITLYETNDREGVFYIIKRSTLILTCLSIIYTIITTVILGFILSVTNIENEIKYNIYYLFICMNTIININMWWVRPFSNVVNPNYSINMNVFSTIFQLLITICVTKYYHIEGMLASLLVMNTLIILMWIKIGVKYVK